MDRTKGFLAYGLTDAEGNFTITSWNEGNMPIGKYTVSVAPPEGKVKVQELTPSSGSTTRSCWIPPPNLSFPSSSPMRPAAGWNTK